jgi:hypothetical protein
MLGYVDGFKAIALLGPILATAAYPIWGWRAGIHARPSLRERWADNSYYLGFIVTQVSLLVGFGIPAITERPITSSDVLGFFGVAVGASMIGLVARTLIVQTGHTVSETADVVHDEVENMSRELGQLATGVSEATRRILSDLDAVSAAMQGSRESITGEVSSWTGALQTSLKSYGSLLDEQIEVSSKSITQVADATRAIVNTSDAQSRVLKDTVAGAGIAIDRLRTELESKATQAAEQILTSAKAITEATDSVRSTQGAATTAISQITENIKVTAKALGQGTEALKALQALGGRIGSLEVAIDNATTAGEAMMGDATARSRQFRDDLQTSTDTLAEALKDFRRELEEIRV